MFQRPAKRKTVEKVGVKGLDSKVEGGKGTAAVLPPRTTSAAAGSNIKGGDDVENTTTVTLPTLPPSPFIKLTLPKPMGIVFEPLPNP